MKQNYYTSSFEKFIKNPALQQPLFDLFKSELPKPSITTYTENMSGYGWSLGYEMTLPRGFYSCIEGSFVRQTSLFEVQNPPSLNFSDYVVHSETIILNVLVRGGFNALAFKKVSILPFLELGAYRFQTDPSYSNSIYSSIGEKLRVSIFSAFSVGLDCKLMRHLYSQWLLFPLFGERKKGHGFVDKDWGYQIALPLTWHIPKGWDIQIEPYLMKVHLKSIAPLMGAQLMVGRAF